MNLNEYQAHAARTANTKLNPRERIIQACFGLTGETGEVTDILKKILFHSHDFDRDALVKETGDCLWYLAELCSAWGITLDEVARTNVAKLRARYPVAFDEERSRNRDEAETLLVRAAGAHE
jgi:NTP pyrophosphatase (non-canonical NTP hydrolase)